MAMSARAAGEPLLTRRDALKVGGAVLAGAALGPQMELGAARAQTPKRGGVFRVRGYDPPHFDLHGPGGISFKLHTLLSFTHSRLFKHKAGPAVPVGVFTPEPDLVDAWEQPGPTTYVFKLKKGVRWHTRPPVNGRELVAEDVRYTFERYMTAKGHGNRFLMEPLDRVEVLDRYTVRFTLKEPYAWFIDVLAIPMACAIVPREAVEKFGDLRKPEACIGTGPWMLESYEPNVKAVLVRNPEYFVSGLPYVDRVEWQVDEDVSSRTAAFLAGRYDFGPEFVSAVRWPDLDVIKRRMPNLVLHQFRGIVWSYLHMRTDGSPFNDVRVRRALSMAVNREAIVEAVTGRKDITLLNPPVPAALVEWTIPLDQLGEARRYLEYNPTDAKRLLGDAGYPGGFKTPLHSTPGYGPDFVDTIQNYQRQLKEVGVDGEIKMKEYGAYIATTYYGGMGVALFTPFHEPDNYLWGYHMPGSPRNQSYVNDGRVIELLREQRRTFDAKKRKELIFEAQRHLLSQCYYVYGPSGMAMGAWAPYVKNYMTNLGYDYGGRMMAAWLDK
jgi:peptide/nickel transport system substrate-binding protein